MGRTGRKPTGRVMGRPGCRDERAPGTWPATCSSSSRTPVIDAGLGCLCPDTRVRERLRYRRHTTGPGAVDPVPAPLPLALQVNFEHYQLARRAALAVQRWVVSRHSLLLVVHL